jgi:hypothetical protein
MRQAFTAALVNPGRASWPYQAMNSSKPRLYTRRVIGEETLSKTKAFSLCHSLVCGTTIKWIFLGRV